MGLERLDASLLNRFWLTGDVGSVGRDYSTVLLEAGARPQGADVAGVQAEMTTSDTGMTLLSREGGDARYHDVFGRAQMLGSRAGGAPAQAETTARNLGLDFGRLSDELAKVFAQRNGLDLDDAGRNALLDKAKDVLSALFSSEEVQLRALEHRELSRAGVLALLNAGLGCLKLIADGQATQDSIFELVRGDVYDITRPADVLKLTVKMAQKARETFVNAAQVRALAQSAVDRIAANASLPAEMKATLQTRVTDAAERVIAVREKLCKSLDVSFSLGDGSRKTLEKQLKDVRERLRAFRYDLDRLGGVKMDVMERLRRCCDNLGRAQPTLTRASFYAAEDAERSFNFLVQREFLDQAGADRGNAPRFASVLDRARLDATTHITHLANNRVRYYFSGKEQKIEAFRQKAHEVLDPLLEKGGSRTLQFEVGADAKFRANVGFAKADCKIGANYQYTAEVSVDAHTHEVTVVRSHGGKVVGEATAKLGHNDGDAANTWDDAARNAASVVGGSVGGTGSAGVAYAHTVKYRSVDDFIASLGGESSLVTRTPYGTMACLGKICGFFKLLGHGVMSLMTVTGLRIAKSREDNAAYVAEMHRVNLMGAVDTLVAHRENAIRTQDGTSWNASGSIGGSGSLNVGSFDGTEDVTNPDTGVEEEKVLKHERYGLGVSANVSYERTFARTARDLRTHLDTARSHTGKWLEERVGAWWNQVPAGEGRAKNALRAIEADLQRLEDGMASRADKTREDWQAFADRLGVLALRFALVEKIVASEGVDMSALADRLTNPRVAIPDDLYDELMQDVAGVSESGTHKVTVDFSVDWSFGSGAFGDVGEAFSDATGAPDEIGSLVGTTASESVATLVPSSCTVKGSYTYTKPTVRTSVCAWMNTATHKWSIQLTPGLTTRALVEFLATKFADVHAEEKGDESESSVKKVAKETYEDWKVALEEALGIEALEIVWDKSMGELAKYAPKVAAFLNAPVTGAGTGLDASVDTDYSKRMTFTVAGGRLSDITVDDYTKVGSSIGVRTGDMNQSYGVHMKETLTTVDVDRAVLVRPNLVALMGKAEAFLRQGDRAGFTGLLAHNAPGTLRLWRALSGNVGPGADALLAADRDAAEKCVDEALRILFHVADKVEGTDPGALDRAAALHDRLVNALQALRDVPDDAEHRAARIDAVAEVAWTLTECFAFARELGGFSRNGAGDLVLPDNLAPRTPSWAARVDGADMPYPADGNA